MSNYILLRDNKQNGPLSLQQILQIGFKPYDLVWIEGKSAAWRYPYEISEFKEYAATTEEQPFDRFYKKTSTEESVKKQSQENISPAQPNTQKQNEKNETNTTVKNFTSQKTVFVTLPEVTINSNESLTNPIPAPGKTVDNIHDTAEIKYSQPLDDIKEMYVKKMLERRQRNFRKEFIGKYLKKASVIVLLVAAGIVAGYTLKSNKKKETVSYLPQTNQPTENKLNPKEEIITEQPPGDIISENDEPRQQIQIENNKAQLEKIPEKQINVQPLKKENTSTQAKAIINPNQNSPGAEIDPVSGERNKKSRTNDISEPIQETEKPKTKNDFSDLASVKSNNYQRGAFGGIRNLELTVTNQSKYLLDEVVVELQYLKPSEEILRSQNIVFKTIPADGTLTIAIPPTNRGIKVAYKIVRVESHELNDDLADL